MSKWIDARWMTSVVDRMVGHNSIRPRDIYDAINDAPSIDIVRCKECKWFDTDNLGDRYCSYSGGMCRASADSFCSYGERRE